MNDPILMILIRAARLGATVALAGFIAGCGGHSDCTQALATADEAVRSHQPPGEWLNRVDAACADAAMERWTSALAQECAPVFGFHAALTGAGRPAECTAARFDSAWSLGEMVSAMRSEADEIEQRLSADSISPETRRELERRLVVIGRDLPQVEALARMDGYLPPAEVPDSD